MSPITLLVFFFCLFFCLFQAFECVCDVLVVFGPGKSSSTDAQSVCVSPDDTLRAELASFLIDYIFSDPEDEGAGKQMYLLSIIYQNIIFMECCVLVGQIWFAKQ